MVSSFRLSALFLSLALIPPASANASTCPQNGPTLKEAVKKSEAVFKGVVKEVTPISPESAAKLTTRPGAQSRSGPRGGPDYVIVFEPTKVWKGPLLKSFSVAVEDGSVGLGGYYYVGEEYLVFAKKNDNDAVPYTTDACIGTDGSSESTNWRAPEVRKKIHKLDDMFPAQK